MSETAARIEMERVVGRYGDNLAVGPVSGHLEGAGVTWVTGGNGAGKTTLLRLLAGLKRPAEGRIAWRVGAGAVTARQLAGRLGFHSPEIRLYEELSAGENLEFVARCRGLARPRAASAEALSDCGLEGRGSWPPSAFSSGQRQRLRLAAAWIGEPPFLLLDEPSTNLDEAGIQWLWARLARLRTVSLCVVATNRREEVQPGDPRVELGGGAV